MVKALNFVNFIVDQDIFGHAIKVNYQSKDAYKTRLGALCTIATYILMAINFVTLMTAFIDGSN